MRAMTARFGMGRVGRWAAAVLAGAIALAGCEKQAPAPAQPATSTQPATATQPTPAKPAAHAIRVGFAQIGAESDWRRANTESIRSEAAARGIDLALVDAQQKQENQVRAVRSFIAQHVDVIALAPVVETGWEPVLKEAKAAGIPVILTDRTVEVSSPDLFVTFIGADFVEEGRRAAAWMIKTKGGHAVIAELQGTPGAAPAIDRHKGFAEGIAGTPGMKIIKSQTGEFTRAKGREVMEAMLKSPEGATIDAVFAHNDDMALGAAQAIAAAGKKPGVDVVIVSIDGVRAALEGIRDGTLNCSVECSPLLGPVLMDTAQAVASGKTVERRIVTAAQVFDAANAAAALPTRKY